MIFLFKIYALLNIFLGSSLENYFGLSIEKTRFLTSIHYRTVPLLILCYILAKNKIFRKQECLLVGLCLIVLFVASLLNKGAMFGVLINNAIEPVVLICVLRNINCKKFLCKSLILFFFIECIIAWIEVINKQILFADLSFMADNRVSYMLENEMRAFSLHGHPLQNAFIVSILSFFFLTAKGKIIYRYGLFAIGFITLFAFNTRSSIYLMTFIAIIFIVKDIRSHQLKTYQKNLIIAILLIAISLILYMMVHYDFGARLSQGLSLKDDSSNTRYMLIGIIANLSAKNLLFGMDDGITLITEKYGFFAIENSLANFIITDGIIFTLCWCILIYMCLSTINSNKSKYRWSFLVFFALLNANNALMTEAPIIIFYIFSLYALDELQVPKTQHVTSRIY